MQECSAFIRAPTRPRSGPDRKGNMHTGDGLATRFFTEVTMPSLCRSVRGFVPPGQQQLAAPNCTHDTIEETRRQDEAESDTHNLSELRRRRAELLESINSLEQALAAPVPGRQMRWVERVSTALLELSGDFHDHVELTEGPERSVR